jgi:hypothetical protein
MMSANDNDDVVFFVVVASDWFPLSNELCKR